MNTMIANRQMYLEKQINAWPLWKQTYNSYGTQNQLSFNHSNEKKSIAEAESTRKEK